MTKFAIFALLAAPLAISAAPAHALAPLSAAQDVAEATDAEVTDREIALFADLMIQGRSLQQDTTKTEDQRNAEMLSLLQNSELGLERFSEVSQAINNDPALQEKVVAAVASKLTPA